jgi:hypothetical protein
MKPDRFFSSEAGVSAAPLSQAVAASEPAFREAPR